MKHNEIDLVDGSIYAFQVSPHEGLAYVTIAGPDEDKPMIIGFDLADLDRLKSVRKELRAGVTALKPSPTEPDPAAVLDILNAAGLSDRFVHDRVEYRYLDGKWVAWGRVDTEDDEPVCECDEAFCPNFHVTEVRDRKPKRRTRKAVTG